MIDWTSIITAVIGLVVGGAGVGGFFYHKANKGGATADAIDKASDALTKAMDLVDKQQAMHNKLIESKDRTIEQQQDLINEYKCSLEKTEDKLSKATRQLEENSVAMSSSARKMEGLQKINNEVQSEIRELKKQLEVSNGIKCTVLDCTLREPPRKNESA